ncbi:Tm-1-like ATP-binding domain-containing protein [Anaerolineales bacterium]
MTAKVVLIGTLDTKGPEVKYLRDRLQSLGLKTTVVDTGILGEPLDIVPDISRNEVARYANATIEDFRNAGSRGRAVEGMRAALPVLILDLFEKGELDAVVGLGGAEGAVMSAAGMMVLPVGVPKILISPIASGYHFFGPLVGTSDMMIVHSVIDILGINPISQTIFDNVAAAIKGQLEYGHSLLKPDPSQAYVAITMLGNTTRAVMAAKDVLADAGYQAVIFHSNGVGGPAMEQLAEKGLFMGVIDFTTNEVYDPLVGGIHDGGPHRLETIGLLGIPQIIVPGCIDFSVWNTGTVPQALAGRPVYDHNPEFILVRATAEEMQELGVIFAYKLNQSRAPLQIAVPTRGLSIPNTPDGVFWDPAADAGFLNKLKENIREDIPVHTFENHVNDPEFGRIVARLFIEMMENQ